MGIYPFQRLKKPYDKYVQTFSFYLFFTNLGMIIAASAVYLYSNFSSVRQLPDAVVAFLTIFACLANVGSYLTIVKNKEKLEQLNDKLQEIVDNGKMQ